MGKELVRSKMIDILFMTANHVPAVAALEAVCFVDPWSEKSVASELTNPLSFWLVAVDGDVVAGYVGSQTVMGETDMMNVAVHPDYRRKGIAYLLINNLIKICAVNNMDFLNLEVRESNCNAISLYNKLGFEIVFAFRNSGKHDFEINTSKKGGN